MAELQVLDKNTRRPFFSPIGLANYLDVSERTVREWLAEGLIPSYRLGGRRRINPDDVDIFLSQRRERKAA